MSSPPPPTPPSTRPPRPAVPFRCPICRSQVYVELGHSKNGRPIFECGGCSVLFRDPERFTRFDPFAARIEAPDLTRNWKS